MTKTVKVELELTKDELLVLMYVVPSDSSGDPLKDIYDTERQFNHEIAQPYAALKTLHAKIAKLAGVVDEVMCDCPQEEEE
jgi:hypothetical protein